VQVILFESGVRAAFPRPALANASSVHTALEFVDGSSAGGGTEVLPALTAAVEAPRTPGVAREIAIITDGFIGDEERILRYLAAHRKGLNVFSVGIGSSVNRSIIDALARIGHGEAFVMLPHDDAKQITKKLFRLMSRPSLTDVTIDWGGLPVHDMVPAHPPDLFADRPIVIGAKFDRAASGTVTIHGQLAGKPYEEKLDVTLPAAQSEDASLGYLWARRRITELSDVRPKDEKEQRRIEDDIAKLGLDYHLVTPYTSFVAVDERVRTSDKAIHVTPPVSLPPDVTENAAPPQAFVSNYSVRGGDPELEIRADRDVRGVTVVLPDGELKRCFYDPSRGRFITSFLLPVDLHEGVYVISVVLEHRDGTTMLRRLRMQIDERPPEVEAVLERTRVRPGERVRLVARSTARTIVVLPLDEDIGERDFAARVGADADEMFAVAPGSRALVALQREDARTYATTLVAPEEPGRYLVPVLARDGARNGARAVVELEVVAP
jgi:Ca-activated chloride channel family protein